MLTKVIHYCTSAVLIVAALTFGNWLQSLLGLSIPGSIIGLLLLFASMASGLVKPEWVRPSASILINYMILLFVPVCTGIMIHYQILVDNALAIIVSTVLGSLFALILIALCLKKLLEEKH